LVRAGAFAVLFVCVLAAGCTPPIESRVALSDPGDFPLDERLVGTWSASNQISEWGHWYVRITPGEKPETLSVLLTVVDAEAKPHWFYAAAHPSEVAGAHFLNFRRLAGYGDDYTLFEPDTCRLALPDQEPGYIIARWELPDDDTLQLRFIGPDPSQTGTERWYGELEKLIDEYGLVIRDVPAERPAILADSRPVLDASRDALLNLIIEETPNSLYDRPILQLEDHDGPVAILGRLSYEAEIVEPDPPGQARFNGLQTVMDGQISVGDFHAATTTAEALMVAAECFDSSARPGNIKAKELLQAAGRGLGPSPAEIEAVLGSTDALLEMLEVALLRIRLGDRMGGTILLLQIIDRELAIGPLQDAGNVEYVKARAGDSLHKIFRELVDQAKQIFSESTDASISRDGEDLIERAKKLRKNDADALLFFAELQQELGFGVTAVKSTLRDAAAAAINMPTLVKVGYAQINAGDNEGAKATFDTAKAQPSTSANLAELGQAQAAAGDTEGALLTLDRAAAAAPLAEWHQLKHEAEAQIAAGNLDRAIETLETAATIPDPADMHEETLQALAMLTDGKAEEALAQLQKAEKSIRLIERENLKKISEGYLAAGSMTAAATVIRRIVSNSYNIDEAIDLQVRANDREAAVDNIARYRELRSDDGTSLLGTLVRIAEWQAALSDVDALDTTLREIFELSVDEVVCSSHSFASYMERLGEIGKAELAHQLARRAVEAALPGAAADFGGLAICIEALYDLPDLAEPALIESDFAPLDQKRLWSDAEWLASLAARLDVDGPGQPVVNFLWNAVSMMYADGDRPAVAVKALRRTRFSAEPSDTIQGIFFNSFTPAMAHAYVAAAQSRAGDLPGAHETLGRLEELPLEGVGLVLMDRSGARLLAAHYVAGALRSRGERALARESIARLSALNGRPKPAAFATAFAANVAYVTGDSTGARVAAQEAAEQIVKLPDLDERLDLLMDLAGLQIDRKDTLGASATLLRAYEMADQVPLYSK
jgi:tetratricopeptide (TPR) repeat protein